VNAYRQSLIAAVAYLRDRPLCAHPAELLRCVGMWVAVSEPTTDEGCEFAGEMAAREAALPLKSVEVKLTKLQ